MNLRGTVANESKHIPLCHFCFCDITNAYKYTYLKLAIVYDQYTIILNVIMAYYILIIGNGKSCFFWIDGQTKINLLSHTFESSR